MIAAVAGDVEVFIAIVVVISDCDAHIVAVTFQSGTFGNVFECSILFLMVEAVPILLALLLRNRSYWSGIRQRSAIDEEDVQKPIVVVVEEGDAGPHGFD